MTDILPCPFCGSNEVHHEFDLPLVFIECSKCGTEGPRFQPSGAAICDHEAAHAAWNRRAALTQPEPDGLTPQPILVSERLPGPEDCDAEGLCWWWCSPAERWLRCGIPQPDPTSRIHTHWLPAHALPLPADD